jgi:hypothetical protein
MACSRRRNRIPRAAADACRWADELKRNLNGFPKLKRSIVEDRRYNGPKCLHQILVIE